ncbi:MAG: type II toxin-antitoxin system RelE/ParE family toxin [Oceanicaulis sp.]
MRRIVYADEARLELLAIAEHSRVQWGDVHARSFFEGLKASIGRLAETPEAGPEIPFIRKGLRRWVHRKLAIFYAVEGDTVRVIAVLDGRQDAASTLEDRP